MLTDFLLHLRRQGLPVSTTELLTLLAALEARLIPPGLEDFYHLARLCLVKDESRYDRFDQAFASYFKATTQAAGLERELPEDWLRLAGQRLLSEADKARLEKLGWERLMSAVSRSRISPTIMMSGSWRIRARTPSAKPRSMACCTCI